MEYSSDLSTLQGRAEQFLQGLLHGCPAEDIPRRITNLATASNDNALKELFRAAATRPQTRDGPPAIAPAPPASAHKSKFSLRFSRNKDKERPLKAESNSAREQRCQQEYENVFQVGVKSGESSSAPNGLSLGKQSRLGFSGKGKACIGSSGSSPYNCVFCHVNYSTKGTCKRHIEDIHVAKRFFRCNYCNKDFSTQPEIRKHCASCGAGVMGWTTMVPPTRNIYASEFSPHRLFRTQQTYVDHLLDLSAVNPEDRAIRSWHLKLRNLLEQEVCEQPLRDLSNRLFGSVDGWRNVRWEHERVRKAVKEIEYDKWQEEEGPHDMLRLHAIKNFLEDLFGDRALSTTVSANSPSAANAEPVQKIEDHDEYVDEKVVPSGIEASATETPAKRPLSFESSAIAPYRQPPGPPDIGANPQHQQQSYQHQPAPMPMSPASQVPPHSATFETQQLNGSMVFWPSADQQQPPPYDGTYGHGSLGQPQFIDSMLPDQSFGAGFDNDYLGFADLHVASTVASPNEYMSPATDLYSFHSQTPRPEYGGQSQAEHMPSGNGVPQYSSMAYSSAPGANAYPNNGAPEQYNTNTHGTNHFGGQWQ